MPNHAFRHTTVQFGWTKARRTARGGSLLILYTSASLPSKDVCRSVKEVMKNNFSSRVEEDQGCRSMNGPELSWLLFLALLMHHVFSTQKMRRSRPGRAGPTGSS